MLDSHEPQGTHTRTHAHAHTHTHTHTFVLGGMRDFQHMLESRSERRRRMIISMILMA